MHASPLPLLEPDHWTTPAGPRWRPDKARTFGPLVADLCAKANFAPDPQQALALDLLFAFAPDGSPLTFEFDLMVCRQNLKTGFLKQVALGWLFVTEEPSIVWSSHEMSSTLASVGELFDLIADAPALSKYLPPDRNQGLFESNGKERLELTTGQTVVMKARRDTGGRGLAKRKLIMDEAFALKPAMLGSLIPLMLAQHHPQVVYASSAPRADSDTLREIRDRGRQGISPRLTHIEWLAPFEPCADPDCLHPKDALARDLDCALDREHLLLRANPTVSTGRITLQTLRDARQAMPPAEYAIECLGWAPEPQDAAARPAVDLSTWAALGDKDLRSPARATVVLDVEPDQSATNIGVAGAVTDSLGQQRTLLLVQTLPGTAGAVEAVKRLQANVDVLEVALHPSSQAAVLANRLKAAGVEHHALTSHDVARGCGAMLAGVTEATYAHLHQPELTGQLAVARTRFVNQQQVWDRRDPRVPIGAVAATSIAAHRWAALTAKPDVPPPAPRRARRPVTAGTVAAMGF